MLNRTQITLICAPAGYGKTTLVADWARRRGSDRVAWLSIAEADDRPFEFWSAVIESLIAVSPPELEGALGGLSPPQQGYEPRFVEAVATALERTQQPMWLVLDDVHRLRNREVERGLDALLESAGHHFHVILIGRNRPTLALARLGLSGRLTEITAQDLAFTPAEASAMFEHLGIRLTAASVSELVASTEGWAAGLRLAVGAASDPDGECPRRVQPAEDATAVAEYLFAEVLRNLPADVQEFLHATCVPAHIDTHLAAKLAKRHDAGEVLERLCQANVLVTRLGEPGVYRYHSLLRAHLLSSLTRRDVTAPARQHAEAAEWLASQGEAAPAVEHALRSGDQRLLATIINDTGLDLIISGQGEVVRHALDLPTRLSSLVADQGAAILAALAALDVGDLAAADQWLAVVEKLDWPADPVLTSLRASALIQRSLIGGDVPGTLTETHALQLSPVGLADVDLMLLTQRGPARMRTEDYAGAIDDLQQALLLARAQSRDRFSLAALSQLSGMTGSLCQFRASQEWAHQAIEFATPRGWSDSPRLAYAYLLASWTAFQIGDERAQSRYAELGVSALDGVNNVEVEVGVLSMQALARFEAATGRDRIRAAEKFHHIWQTAPVDQLSPALISLATPQEVRLLQTVGRHDRAQIAADRLERLLPDSAEALALQSQVLMGRGRHREARAVLRPLLQGQAAAHVPTTMVMARLMGATLHARRGAEVAAFEDLAAAMPWAAANNYRRPFIDGWADLHGIVEAHRGRLAAYQEFIDSLFGNLPKLDSTQQHLARALSPRELQILKDLPADLTIEEIAASRGLSPNTVKTHLRGLYSKLDVNTRRDAVRRAHALGII